MATENLDELLEREYTPPTLYIFEEVEIGGGYHTLHAVQDGLNKERDWSEPYIKGGIAQYRNRIVKVDFPPKRALTIMRTDLNALAKECYENAKAHGFYDPVPSFEQRLLLIISEVIEAYEEFRDGRAPTDVRYSANRGTHFDLQKPEGIPSEFADVIIRLLDNCAHHGIDIDTAIREKMAYNKTRPHKHGRAF